MTLHMNEKDRVSRHWLVGFLPPNQYQANAKDYYTLSKEGITHFLANESDFTPLHTWEREYAQFNKIRKVKYHHT